MTDDGIRFDGVRREYDWEKTTPTFAILESMAMLEYGNPDLTNDVLDAPLNDYVDMDGLEQTVQSNVSVTIEFTIAKYAVRIAGKEVCVTPASEY